MSLCRACGDETRGKYCSGSCERFGEACAAIFDDDECEECGSPERCEHKYAAVDRLAAQFHAEV